MLIAEGIPLNCGSFIGENVPIYNFNKPSFGLDKFLLLANSITRVISQSTSGNFVQNDLNLTMVSGSTTITDYIINVQSLDFSSHNVSIYSTNSGIVLGGNQFGVASGVSNGSATLIAIEEETNYFSSSNVAVSAVSGAVVTVFNDYLNNSLAKNISTNTDSKIINRDAEIAKPIYTVQNHETPSYVRNTSCWANDLDLTCISPWNSFDQNLKAGTLISPRHIIFAGHYQINNGATIRFIDNNNNIISRTMITKLTHPQYSVFYPDITIGLLDSDVPSSIKFAKILPGNWQNYLPSISADYTVPALVLDAEEKALISELYELSESASFIQPRTNNSRFNFFESIVLGDSGNPAFLIINNELVIITVWTYGGSGKGTNIAYHKNTINELMFTLGGGYSLTEIDLSSFQNFG